MFYWGVDEPAMIRKAIIVVLTIGAVGTGALWLASIGWSVVCWSRGYPHGLWRGAVAIAYADLDRGVPGETAADGWYISRRAELDRRPMSWLPRQGRFGPTHLSILVPLWMPLLAFSIYPAVAFIRGPLRRRRRRKRGLCVKCGYNLTGLPEPRCPECGEAT